MKMTDQIKPGSYCNIMRYLEIVDPKYSAIMTHACAHMSALSLKGKPGITLLWPQDKALKQKLADLISSDDPNNLGLASDMINAMIFKNVFKSPQDWEANRANLPNSLSPSQHVELDKIAGNAVHFKSGAKIVLDEAFIDGSKKRSFAVWKLLSGEIPVTTDKPAAKTTAKRGAKVGGCADNSQQKRIYIVRRIVENYARELKNNAELDNFNRAIYSLAYKLIKADELYFRDMVMPMFTRNYLTIYCMLEPFRNGDYIISDSVIDDWIQTCSHEGSFICSKTMAEFVDKKLIELANSAPEVAIYGRRIELLNAIDRVRTEIMHMLARPRQLVNIIESYYIDLEDKNAIVGKEGVYVENVYPLPFANRLRSCPSMKLLCDELCYLSFSDFEIIQNIGEIDKIKMVVTRIAHCLSANTDEERKRSRVLLSRTLVSKIAPEDDIKKIIVFVNSTCFMHVPMFDDYNGLGKYTTEYPADITTMKGVYNVEAVVDGRYSAQLSNTTGSTFGKLLDRLDFDLLTEDEKSRLIAKLQRVTY